MIQVMQPAPGVKGPPGDASLNVNALAMVTTAVVMVVVDPGDEGLPLVVKLDAAELSRARHRRCGLLQGKYCCA